MSCTRDLKKSRCSTQENKLTFKMCTDTTRKRGAAWVLLWAKQYNWRQKSHKWGHIDHTQQQQYSGKGQERDNRLTKQHCLFKVALNIRTIASIIIATPITNIAKVTRPQNPEMHNRFWSWDMELPHVTSCSLRSCNEDSQLTITSNAIRIDTVTYYHATNITQGCNLKHGQSNKGKTSISLTHTWNQSNWRQWWRIAVWPSTSCTTLPWWKLQSHLPFKHQ